MFTAWFRQKLFPTQITKRYFIWMALLTTLPLIFLASLFQLNHFNQTKNERVKELHNLAGYLEKELPAPFTEILEEQGAMDKPLQEQVIILNSVLQPIVERLSSSYPEVSMGYYSMEQDYLVAITPDFKLSKLQRIPHDLPFFKVYGTGQPETINYNTSISWEQPIMGKIVPIYRNGKIIGHSFANIRMEDVYAQAIGGTVAIIVVGLLTLVAILLLSWRLSILLKRDIVLFANAIIKEDPDPPQKMLPELIPLLDLIKGYTLGLQATLAQLRQENEQRKKAEEELATANQKNARILASISDAFYAFDQEWRFVYCNKAAIKYFSKHTWIQKEEDVFGKNVWELFPQLAGTTFYKEYHRAFIKQVAVQFEAPSVVNIGGWVEVNAYPSEDGLSVYIRDVTGLKKAREELQRSRQEKINILESITDAFFVLDNQWRFSYINPKAQSYFPDVKDFIGKNIWELFPDSIGTVFWDNYHEVMDKKNPIHFEASSIYNNLWAEFHEFHVYPLQDGISVIFCDITKRKRVEESLRLSEDRFYKVFYNSPAVMAISNADTGEIIDINVKWSKLYSFSREEVLGRTFLDLGLWKNPDLRIPYISRLMSDGSVSGYEVEVCTKNGDLKTVLISAVMVRFSDEVYKISTAIDITDQKKTLQQLRQSEERFFKVFNLSPSMISIRKIKDLTHVDVNQSWLKQFGFEREEVIGRSGAELKIGSGLRIITNSVKNRIPLRNEKISYRKKNGEVYPALVSTEFISFDGEECFVIVMNDISFLEQVEKEMRQLEKLNLIGQMAAGIGHEIRNPLTSVRGFLQHYQSKPVFEEYSEQLIFMIEELDRANGIITDFLSLANNKPAQTRPASLDAIIQSMMPILSANAMEEQKDIIFLKGNTTDVLLDEKEIRQLILNLARNGFEEMGVGGLLTIRTYEDKGHVVLAVDDHGGGISVENISKIGTPFFTTKDTGTGLGLATCYSIAKRHNAAIDFTTGPSGTTFFVRFKIGDGSTDPAAKI